MRSKSLRTSFAILASAGVVSMAQANPSISIEGRFNITEGGEAQASGLLEIVKGQSFGRFKATFTRGPWESVQLTRVESVQIPTVTAFFQGDATARINRFGISMPVRGKFFGYVDDLSGMNPPHPDQIFMRFTTYDGQVFVRHGRVKSGDIAVQL